MNKKNKYLITAAICGIIGSTYLFLPYSIIKKTLGIGFGLRHNDHVMIGILGLTIAVCSLYAFLMETLRPGDASKKRTKF